MEAGIAPDSSVSVEITHYQDDITDTVEMSFSELIELTYNTLISLFPLYANYGDRFQVLVKLHTKYVDSMILPLDEIPYDEED